MHQGNRISPQTHWNVKKSLSLQATRCPAGWCRCAAPTACWCCPPRRSSTWSCAKGRWWTWWSSGGYDAGGRGYAPECTRPAFFSTLTHANVSVSADSQVICYRLPRQPLNILMGRDMGGGRKWCMSIWLPLAVMSYATANRSQRRPSPLCFEQITVFQWRKNRENMRFIL